MHNESMGYYLFLAFVIFLNFLTNGDFNFFSFISVENLVT